MLTAVSKLYFPVFGHTLHHGLISTCGDGVHQAAVHKIPGMVKIPQTCCWSRVVMQGGYKARIRSLLTPTTADTYNNSKYVRTYDISYYCTIAGSV